MDEKHAMLYPPLEPSSSNSLRNDQRTSASAAIGLPMEAPPSYDVAMSGGPVGGSTMGFVAALPATQHHNDSEWKAPSAPMDVGMPATATVIVEQPLPTITMPVQPQHQIQPQPLQHQQQQQPLPNAPQTTVTVTPITSKLGPNPCAVQCPVCGTCKTTRMQYTPNSRTHLCALVLCLVGWCCCACCVPYCMNSCRTGNHYCSKCNTFLGAYDPKILQLK